jgi:hypothetical protein
MPPHQANSDAQPWLRKLGCYIDSGHRSPLGRATDDPNSASAGIQAADEAIRKFDCERQGERLGRSLPFHVDFSTGSAVFKERAA